jgi:hypothetical protein
MTRYLPAARQTTEVHAGRRRRGAPLLVKKLLLRRPEQPDCLLGFASDITELKDAQAATLRSEARFRTLFEASRDAVAVLRQGRIIDGNQALLDMLGVTSRDALRELHPGTSRPPCSPAARPPRLAGEHMASACAWGISVSRCCGATTTAPNPRRCRPERHGPRRRADPAGLDSRHHRPQALRGQDPPAGVLRRPHRPAQPPPVLRPPGPGRGAKPPQRAARRGDLPRSRQLQAGQRGTATAPAICCCRRSPGASPTACARKTPWPAWAATSSSRCWSTWPRLRHHPRLCRRGCRAHPRRLARPALLLALGDAAGRPRWSIGARRAWA